MFHCFQEKEAAHILEEIKNIKRGKFTSDEAEIEKIITNNAKLEYQIKHLQRVTTSWLCAVSSKLKSFQTYYSLIVVRWYLHCEIW